MIEGQDLPEHVKLRSALFALSLPPRERGGGRSLDRGDIGRKNVVISTKIARAFPDADGAPGAVGRALRIGRQGFTVVGLYETGSLVTDMTIVMEIGVARGLLGVAEGSVSTFDVEPARITAARRGVLVTRPRGSRAGPATGRIDNVDGGARVSGPCAIAGRDAGPARYRPKVWG